jgi:hypothetical protein
MKDIMPDLAVPKIVDRTVELVPKGSDEDGFDVSIELVSRPRR